MPPGAASISIHASTARTWSSGWTRSSDRVPIELAGLVAEDLTDAFVGEADDRHLVLVDATGLGHDRWTIGQAARELDLAVGDDHADEDAMAVADVDDVAGCVDAVDEHDRCRGRSDELRTLPVQEHRGTRTSLEKVERRACPGYLLTVPRDGRRELDQPTVDVHGCDHRAGIPLQE